MDDIFSDNLRFAIEDTGPRPIDTDISTSKKDIAGVSAPAAPQVSPQQIENLKQADQQERSTELGQTREQIDQIKNARQQEADASSIILNIAKHAQEARISRDTSALQKALDAVPQDPALRKRVDAVLKAYKIPTKEPDKNPGPEVKGEKLTRKEIDERVKIAAGFLESLDKQAEQAKIDPATGKIDFTQIDTSDLTDAEQKKYQERFAQLQARFDQRNQQFLQVAHSTPGVLDAKIILGAVVITYDSSKQTPPIVPNGSTGFHAEANERYLGFVGVDLNVTKAKGTPSNVTLTHELQHQAKGTTDYLLSQDPVLDMQSTMARGRNKALYGSGLDKITPGQAMSHDADVYTQLLGREFDFNRDFTDVLKQGHYLNELHSSFLQRKGNWFSQEIPVYTAQEDGKHWEVVGKDPADQQAARDMLGYMQGFFIMDQARQGWEKNGSLGPVQQAFVKEFPDIYRQTGALIGASRTVAQARDFVDQKWREVATKYPKLLERDDIKANVAMWEQGRPGEKPHGVAGLSQRLLSK